MDIWKESTPNTGESEYKGLSSLAYSRKRKPAAKSEVVGKALVGGQHKFWGPVQNENVKLGYFVEKEGKMYHK